MCSNILSVIQINEKRFLYLATQSAKTNNPFIIKEE